MSTVEPNRTVFALGCGEHAIQLGEFSTVLDVNDIAALPVGRELLSVTDSTIVRHLFDRFAHAIDAAGIADYAEPQPSTVVPGTASQPAPWVPYAHRQDVYTLDNGQWFVWRAIADDPQWYALALRRRADVDEYPVARRYGAFYRRTRGLELPELAAWILGEATMRLGPAVVGCMARIVTEQEGSPTLDLLVHADPDEDATTVRSEVARVAEHHNWSNPCAPNDVRFHTNVEIAFSNGKHVCGQITTEHLHDRDE